MAERVFHQCSRRAPDFAAADFEPDAGTIRDLEAKLPAAFAAAAGGLRYRGSGEKLDLGSYYREYAAYLSDGRRRIYGNYAPLTLPPDTGDGPMLVCDGGPAFFGVEYDVERQEIVAVEFNGDT